MIWRVGFVSGGKQGTQGVYKLVITSHTHRETLRDNEMPAICSG
jgi:hypothetical protein